MLIKLLTDIFGIKSIKGGREGTDRIHLALYKVVLSKWYQNILIFTKSTVCSMYKVYHQLYEISFFLLQKLLSLTAT